MIENIDIKEYHNTVWDFGNKILYNLCQSNFEHKEIEKIITKTLFIGRIYAAAIERRNSKSEVDKISTDDFYINYVVPALKNSDLDNKLFEIKKLKLEENNYFKILELHKKIVSILGFTGLQKRSFASKYLHFHLPCLFFIYDSIADRSINLILKKSDLKISKEIQQLIDKNENKIDKEYAIFFFKCLLVKNKLELMNSRNEISPRLLDNILLKYKTT